MDVSLKEHKTIINLLGGGKKLTERLKMLSNENINEKTVYSWVRQGIPDRWKIAVSRCLLEDSIDISNYNDIFHYILLGNNELNGMTGSLIISAWGGIYTFIVRFISTRNQLLEL